MKITKTVTLRKYNNRKLYSPKGEMSDESRYVNLTDVVDTIRFGNTVVIKSKEGEDVTNSVLKEALKDLDLSNDSLVKLIRS